VSVEDPRIPDKFYFRIGEVSRLLGVEAHVVRFWESEFPSVRPIRTKSDQRLYRKKDVETLLKIRKLLYEEKFTIAGAKKHLSQDRAKVGIPSPDPRDKLLAQIKKGLISIKKIIT
jgi:DNA-binding transcriptional MerR regulator